MPGVLEALSAQGSKPMDPDYPRQNAERWNPGFLAAWDYYNAEPVGSPVTLAPVGAVA